MTKIIALYLPQFHETKENNEWWGQGFTEWTNTKKAKPLFYRHYQPRIPLHEDYYDLTDSSVMKKQSDLAKKFGIYGFCFYHYWFNGIKMLERPIENLLQNRDIDIPFCFSWANDTWTRTWDDNEKEILLKQEYGEQESWLKHLTYLLPFFKDKRYILENNKPVFIIYRTVGFDRMNELIAFWNSRLIEEGFAGIHVVETLNSFQQQPFCEMSKAVFEFEPMLTLRSNISFMNKIKGRLKQYLSVKLLYKNDYNDVWIKLLKNAQSRQYPSKEVYRGAFVDWDNTPRKGKNGMAITGASPKKFEKYFNTLVRISNQEGGKFLFINAWNEWAEGAYLEPDERYHFSYLEAVKEVVKKNFSV